MNLRKTLWWMLFVLVVGTMAAAQVPRHIAIESGNGGSVIAPTNPNGFLNVGPYVWAATPKASLAS